MILPERDAKLMLIELNIPSLGSDIVVLCVYVYRCHRSLQMESVGGANKIREWEYRRYFGIR